MIPHSSRCASACSSCHGNPLSPASPRARLGEKRKMTSGCRWWRRRGRTARAPDTRPFAFTHTHTQAHTYTHTLRRRRSRSHHDWRPVDYFHCVLKREQEAPWLRGKHDARSQSQFRERTEIWWFTDRDAGAGRETACLTMLTHRRHHLNTLCVSIWYCVHACRFSPARAWQPPHP